MPAAQPAGIDLSGLYQVFFEEAAENLASFEQRLLELDPAAPDDEALHAIFRSAHSVKGGAATFGFAEEAALTHAMETLLDRLRRHEQAVTEPIVDTLLHAGDMLREMLAARQQGEEPPKGEALLAQFAAHAAPAAAAAALPAASGPAERELELLAGPLQPLSLADDLLELFREVSGVGTLERAEALPGQPGDSVRFRLRTTAIDGELLDLCSFHLARERIRIAPWPGTQAAGGASDAAAASATAALSAAAASAATAASPAASSSSAPAASTPPPPSRAANHRAGAGSETLRVALEKVDQLINLMGELVITQAMLAQRAERIDPRVREPLEAGLADLERTTRNLQESVMAIRMIPMGEVFQRFPRMLRDLAGKLGKQVQLHTEGEATELDKGMIEKITDPLTHLVRNSVDHGFELPQQRVAAGKPAVGTLTLAAKHEGGCIVIEVRDDGRGLDRERILAKARANGMALPEAMDDAEVWQLIFAPGFSTADAVTDVSGRGVGMDVVRRNILGLGGSVELQSRLGEGTCVRVRLPLTLAIMDGITVRVGGELYVLPLASVVESFQADPARLQPLPNGQRVVRMRDEYLPVVPLGRVLECAVEAGSSLPMLVLVQSEGRRVVLEVGELVGQQQVVVKNLEANYRRVPGLAGATVMGDGSVALILDVAALVRGAAGAGSSPAAAGR